MGALARVRWLNPDQGGRPAPLHGRQYSTVAKCDGQTDQDWRNNAWSLVLSFKDSANENGV